MALFLGIAGHTALALGKARLHEQLMAQVLLQKDLQMAERIQHSFLPKSSPRLDGYRFAQSYSAARHIGGDYYDFVQVSDNALGIAVADVAGKGVAAALYMAKLSSEMRFHARGCLSRGCGRDRPEPVAGRGDGKRDVRDAGAPHPSAGDAQPDRVLGRAPAAAALQSGRRDLGALDRPATSRSGRSRIAATRKPSTFSNPAIASFSTPMGSRRP